MLELLSAAFADAERTFTLWDWAWRVFLFCAVIWAGFFWEAPMSFLASYGAWVHEKHGRGIEIGMGLLLLVLGPPLVISVIGPGQYPVLDVFAPVAFSVWLGFVAWDIWRFCQHRRRSS